MDRPVLPRLLRPARARAETALTLAALEMSAAGVAVAWVPHSLAAERLADGTLADLSDRLPHQALDITAVRLRGSAGATAQAVWDALFP
jgi:LysR family transcriptional regulator, hypochlorite-specific transcription factor HypT